jgi:UDP-N-acetylglucosamine 1-carboxyvinyltransferase
MGRADTNAEGGAAMVTVAREDVLIIRGGRRLSGTVTLHGAKNAALPCLAATLLMDRPVRLDNVPPLDDVATMLSLLQYVGASVERNGHSVRVNAAGPLKAEAPADIAQRMRASFLVAGPLLARVGQVDVALPGGCAIGERPVDLHLEGFRALGAEVQSFRDRLRLQVPASLRGAHIRLRWPSVGATENIMMAAVLAEGETVLDNAAREPEIEDLGNFLAAAGARVDGLGTRRLTIRGVTALNPPDRFAIRRDRIEAATYLLAAAVTEGTVTVEPFDDAADLAAFVATMREGGASVSVESTALTLAASRRALPVEVVTEPFPGFPTDLQAPLMAWLATGSGTSTIIETVFERRFGHVAALRRMGADIAVYGERAVLRGVSRLHGAEVSATDLRAAAALVLAALGAEGFTVIHGLEHLERGYADLPQTLTRLGAAVEYAHKAPEGFSGLAIPRMNG